MYVTLTPEGDNALFLWRASGSAIAKPPQDITHVDRAILLLMDNPEPPESISAVAQAVGCSKSTLTRNPKFMRAWNALNSEHAGKPPPKGYKRDGDVEITPGND